MVIYPLIGGAGTTLGPIIGAGIFEPLSFIISSSLGTKGLPGIHLLLIGVLFLVIIITCPQGLVGLFKQIRKKFGMLNKKR
jgi:branched-chain amino acid transport system permease protein